MVSFNKFEECLKTLEKLRKNSEVESINFNGQIDKKAKIENYSINWTEEEEIK